MFVKRTVPKFGLATLITLGVIAGSVGSTLTAATVANAAAHDGACTSADTKGNTTTYVMTVGGGTITQEIKGFETQTTSFRNSTTSTCVAIDQVTDFTKTSASSKSYEDGPATSGACNSSITLTSNPTAAGTISGSLQMRTSVAQRSGGSSCLPQDAAQKIPIKVNAGGQACTNSSTPTFTMVVPGVIKGTLVSCKTGTVSATYQAVNGSDTVFSSQAGATLAGCADSALDGVLTLDRAAASGDTSVPAKFAATYLGTRQQGGQCLQGDATTETVKINLVGCAGGIYSAICGNYSALKCVSYQTQSDATYRDCLQTYTNNFVGFLTACKADLTTASRADVTCVEGKAPEMQTELEALLNAGVNTTSSCNIPQLGWILCPVLTIGSSLADSAYGFLADSFLSTDPSLVNTDPNATVNVDNGDGTSSVLKVGTGTYTAWGVMRNFANVAFVIVFLLVIFSQLTSWGISNLGIKKMLPKLVVAAILVNLSFFITQIGVDLSNIVGYSLKDLLAGIAGQITAGGTAPTGGSSDGGNVFGGLATAVIAGALVWINISAFLVMLAGALIALLMIFVILIARKALIVILIMVAPLAFVAYLLPNTEGLFKRWRQALVALLMLFPVIGLIYGGSLVASAVLTQAAGSDVVMRIAAAAVTVIPLVAVPFVLRGSLSSIGKFGGVLNSFSSRAQGVGKGLAQKNVDRSRLGQYKKYREGVTDRRRAQIQGGTYRGSNRNPVNWARNLRSAGNRGVNAISGNFGSGLAASGAAIASEEVEREVKNATALMQEQRLTSDETTALAHGNAVVRDGETIMRAPNEAMRQAAVREAMRIGTIGIVEDLLVTSAGASERVRQEMSRGIHANGHDKAATYLGGDFADRVIRGEIGSQDALDNAVARRLNAGKLSAEAMVDQDATALERIARVSSQASVGFRRDIAGVEDVNPTVLANLRGQANEAINDFELHRKTTGQKAPSIDIMSRIGTANAAPVPQPAPAGPNGGSAPASTTAPSQGSTPASAATFVVDGSRAVTPNSARGRAEGTIREAARGTIGPNPFLVERSGEVTEQQPAPFSIPVDGPSPAPTGRFSDIGVTPGVDPPLNRTVNPSAIPEELTNPRERKEGDE